MEGEREIVLARNGDGSDGTLAPRFYAELGCFIQRKRVKGKREILMAKVPREETWFFGLDVKRICCGCESASCLVQLYNIQGLYTHISTYKRSIVY